MKAGVCKNGHPMVGRNRQTWERKKVGANGEPAFVEATGCRTCRNDAQNDRRRRFGRP